MTKTEAIAKRADYDSLRTNLQGQVATWYSKQELLETKEAARANLDNQIKTIVNWLFENRTEAENKMANIEVLNQKIAELDELIANWGEEGGGGGESNAPILFWVRG